MGNITFQRFKLHRFLAMAVSHSTTVDPRHLEHHIYPYWTAEFAALIIPKDFQCSLVAPQFPVYVSPKEPSLDPNTSGDTEADGQAQGVYVDIAIVIPIVQPPYCDELGAIGPQLVGQSMANFFDEIQPHLQGFSPRCVWISGHEAPVLGELKHDLTRHARKISTFLTDLTTFLKNAEAQAQAQTLCLFCSWRLGTRSFATCWCWSILSDTSSHQEVACRGARWTRILVANPQRPQEGRTAGQ
ncbi:hypothetical protein B0H12DRAFT_1106914 [Mycena haematopus]|nr:hypothetical protein B0H12DRAFT_1106914 [Mycena haematopus]